MFVWVCVCVRVLHVWCRVYQSNFVWSLYLPIQTRVCLCMWIGHKNTPTPPSQTHTHTYTLNTAIFLINLIGDHFEFGIAIAIDHNISFSKHVEYIKNSTFQYHIKDTQFIKKKSTELRVVTPNENVCKPCKLYVRVRFRIGLALEERNVK